MEAPHKPYWLPQRGVGSWCEMQISNKQIQLKAAIEDVLILRKTETLMESQWATSAIFPRHTMPRPIVSVP